jgi:hypothetical protein
LRGSRLRYFKKQPANGIELFAAHLFNVRVGNRHHESAKKRLRVRAQFFARDQRFAEIG